MEKIKVSICSSPDCHIQSGQLFMELDSLLGASLSNHIELTGSSCNQQCAIEGCPLLAPCAEIDGQLMTQATSGDILDAIQTRLRPARLVA